MSGISQAEKLKQLQLLGESVPLCSCHSLPMAWSKSNKKTQGGSWNCIEKRRARGRKWTTDKYQNDPSFKKKMLEYKKEFYKDNADEVKTKRKQRYHSSLIVRENAKKYSHNRYMTNPAVRQKLKEYAYKRRALLNKAKRVTYTDQDVWNKSQGLCYFCQKPVDSSFKYPHPESPVKHHLHPISKRGADVLKNISLAHNFCNGSVSNTYSSPFKSWQIKETPYKIAMEKIIAHHYLHRKANASYIYGLYDELDVLTGVVTFGVPASNRTSLSVCPSNTKLVLELTRLWIDDDAPFGAASWLVSRALKQLPSRIIISYADLDQGHEGTIYKALSFNYAGQSKARNEWRIPGKTRNVGKIEGAQLHKVSAKNRYWTVTGNKRQKNQLRRLVKWPSI